VADDTNRHPALQRWAAEAATLDWTTPWDRVHDEEAGPRGRWFPGGTLNVAANCLDRHLAERGGRVAIHWEGEPGDRRSLTYRELYDEVATFASALTGLGVGPGDRVAIYLGLIPEAIVAMLACARLGAVHSVLVSALPAEAVADRLGELRPKVLVTQDGSWRHGVVLPLKARADEALAATAGVEATVVVRRTGIDVAWYQGDRWYHELTAAADDGPEPVALPVDHPLLVVHLASQRGSPSGIVHRAGGFLLYASTMHRLALSSGPDDVFWCAVDIGWVAGQSHGVYGPLAAGATTVAFEGMLDTPTPARTWEIIDRYGVRALVTTPSILRRLRGWRANASEAAAPDPLDLIVHLGEPIDARTRGWLGEELGRGRATVRDGWGQTELGGIVTVEPHPSPGLPDPGLAILGADDLPVPDGEVGELVVRNPWPSLLLDVQGEGPQAGDRYWRRPGCYATGDLARRRPDGSLEILGRTDPVVSVSGQLVSANEVRDVLEEHPVVAAAEVVGRPDGRTGQAVAACVVLDAASLGPDTEPPPSGRIAAELRHHVHETLGGLAQPRSVLFLEKLPRGLPRPLLRDALALLAGASSAETAHVTPAQLQGALAASGSRPR
jgi:acetyl-CoA synthetase